MTILCLDDPALTQSGGLEGQRRDGPMIGLGVDIGCDGCSWKGRRDDRNVPAVEYHQGIVAIEVLPRCFDGDGSGFVGNQRDVVFAVVDRQHTLSGVLAPELEMGHEGDVRGGIVDCDRQQAGGVRILAFDLPAFHMGLKRDHGHAVEIGKQVWIAWLAAPVEVRGNEISLCAAQFQLEEVGGSEHRGKPDRAKAGGRRGRSRDFGVVLRNQRTVEAVNGDSRS